MNNSRHVVTFIVLLLAGCSNVDEVKPDEFVPLSEQELIAADLKVVTGLQSLASKACTCARAKRESHYEPAPAYYYEPGMKPAQPSPCWREFAQALRPYKFELGPAAACGPGSDHNTIELGGHSVDIHFGFGTCSPAQADAALQAYNEKKKRKVRGCA